MIVVLIMLTVVTVTMNLGFLGMLPSIDQVEECALFWFRIVVFSSFQTLYIYQNISKILKRERTRYLDHMATLRILSHKKGTSPTSHGCNIDQIRGFWFAVTGDDPKDVKERLKGKVKQIVGSTLQDLKDGGSDLVTNFVSDKSASEFADLYKKDGLIGGHVIMLGADSRSIASATEALHTYPGGLQVGGGINSDNALNYLEEGASHVIVTSYVFSNGNMDLQKLKDLSLIVGKKRLVLDLSCRKKDGKYAIVTDRWQKFSNVYLDKEILDFFAIHADEFLVHGVDVEGKRLGIDEELVEFLGKHSPIPVTYAGGVTTMEDLERIKVAGMERVDVTVGSALDIFGGELAYKDVVAWHKKQGSLVN